MKTDFIKWIVKYAEGFTYKDYYGGTLCYMSVASCSFNIARITGDKLLYPLLLQRAIEGVNKSETYRIEQKRVGVFAWVLGNEYTTRSELFAHTNIDEAKEEALKYIYNKGAEW